MATKHILVAGIAILLAASVSYTQAPPPEGADVDKWITATGETAGADANAKDEAVKMALRKAVEQACGVFIKAQSKTKDYQAVYDKVLTNTVGYVLEHKVIKTWVEGGNTLATVKARVSTKKFEEDWASIAHTLHQEGNPRVIFAIAEATNWTTTGPAYQTEENGTVQTKFEEFFTEKGITLMDRVAAGKVTKRDLMLATIKDDASEIAAVGARFKADVVIVGKASAKMSKKISVDDQGHDLYQYTVNLNIYAVQTDSARKLATKSFTKNYNEVQRNAEDKVLSKLADESKAEFLKALIEAWAKRANDSRTVELNVSGMDYDAYKIFKVEAEKIRGVQALRQREITEGVATIDVEYEFTNENLADRLTAMKDIKLKVVEITANRIKLKVVKE